jgi:transposase
MSEIEGLPIIRPDVAGIDLGSEQHWVCAAKLDRSGREVESFGATTPELKRLAKWLKQRQIRSVAMESTGVYWIAPHEVLEAEGLEVLLVNTQQLAQVPGRNKKTDPEDCQWIQRLHSCGLLRGSFRPAEQICMLRTLVRDKANLVAESGDWVRRMQKSLDQMNVRIHRAVSDLDGVTGLAMVRAIVAGQRDPRKLAQLRDRRCRKSEEEIAEQLSGHWREDHLFSLRQGLKMYETIQERISDYQQEIVQTLAALEQQGYQGQDPPPLPAKKAKTIRKRGQEGMRQALYRMSGVDLTRIDAVGVETVEVVLSEYGPDLSRFPTEKQFVSHATLAPHVPKTGGKPVKKKKKPHSASGRVAAALRMAALSLRHSETALGAYYRRLAARAGPDVAVFATARRLAVLIYRMIRWGQAYVDEGAQAYELRYQQARLKTLAAKAKDLGYYLTPATP